MCFFFDQKPCQSQRTMALTKGFSVGSWISPWQTDKWCTHPAKVHFMLHPESVISHHSVDENLGMRTHMEHQ